MKNNKNFINAHIEITELALNDVIVTSIGIPLPDEDFDLMNFNEEEPII